MCISLVRATNPLSACSGLSVSVGSSWPPTPTCSSTTPSERPTAPTAPPRGSPGNKKRFIYFRFVLKHYCSIQNVRAVYCMNIPFFCYQHACGMHTYMRLLFSICCYFAAAHKMELIPCNKCPRNVRRDRSIPPRLCVRYLSPSVAGFLLQKELDYLQASTSKIGRVDACCPHLLAIHSAKKLLELLQIDGLKVYFKSHKSRVRNNSIVSQPSPCLSYLLLPSRGVVRWLKSASVVMCGAAIYLFCCDYSYVHDHRTLFTCLLLCMQFVC